jgi:hypothetical protein
MRKRLIWTLALSAIAAVAFAAVAFAAKPTIIRVGKVILTVNGNFSPKKLSKKKLTPIKVNVNGKIRTSDGTHPPAMKEVVVEFDKNSAVNAKGLPVCKLGKLVAQDTKRARKACPKAIVGHGSAEAEVEFPEQAPFKAKGPLVFFNGGTKGGKTTLFIHYYAPVPAPTALITIIKISKVRHGRYGVKTVSKLPRIAGGYGSILRFDFTVDRKFKYKGKKKSYASAKCPDGHLNARVAKATFADGTKAAGTVIRRCTGRK